MKTTKIAASLLSLSIIVPGLIVSNPVPTQAQYEQDDCQQKSWYSKTHKPYQMKLGDTLFKIARDQGGDADRWEEISKPGSENQPYTEEEASDLAEGDIVCIPKEWSKNR